MLRELQAAGRSGKTLTNYVGALGAFCKWCVQRGYLTIDPLASIAPFDTTPQSQRRAMTSEEITALLEVCPSHRRLLYEVAFLTGLRVNELRNLTVGHLDVENSGLRLDAEWTKNRKPGFQPLPATLTNHLQEYAGTDDAPRLYAQAYGDNVANAPTDPLLYVPSHTARTMDQDLETAGIEKYGPGGKLDFQACRVAYINMVIESGVTVKEAQELARHSTPQLTMNVYGRARPERLTEAVEKVGETVLQTVNRAPYVHRMAVGAEQENATPLPTRGCVSKKLVAQTLDSTNLVWDKFQVFHGHRRNTPYIQIGQKSRKPRRLKTEKHPNAIKQALHYQDLLESGQADSQGDLARLIGTPRSTISNYLRLLGLPKDIQTEALGIDDDDERISMLTEGRLRRLLDLADPAAQSGELQALLSSTTKEAPE